MNTSPQIQIRIAACLLAASVIVRAGFPESGEWREPLPQNSGFTEVARGKGIAVRVSPEGGLLTSKDGSRWVEARLDVRTFLRSVTFGQGLFVAVGGSYVDAPGVILTSNNGENWLRRHPKNRINLHGVACGNGLLVAVGDAGTIFTSHDGACWKNRRSGTTMALATIAFGNGIFVAGGESGTILTSTNGLSWIKQNLGESVYVGKVLFQEGTFLAANSQIVFTSTDGQVWNRRPIATAKIP
jgi:photosystem II stability/assembly factor-like uncharacterized protein